MTSQGNRTASPARRVLVVEDNPDSRETLRILLKLWGHQVEVAADGLRGVEMALDWQPEVAVVDIGLPKMDGYQVARRVRAALHDRIFLIALTGYSQYQDRQQALDAGFDVHMTKPADLEKLSHFLDCPRN